MNPETIQQLAKRLDASWEGAIPPIEPLSSTDHLQSIEDAYRIQSAWNEIRVRKGERVIGRKIGLTSRAIQQQLGVNQPDFGVLWRSRYFPTTGTTARIPHHLFLQPRVEGELAFLLGQPLEGPHITPQEVLAATEALAVSIEIVDSRIKDWRIKIFDTIADNASYGGFTVGPWQRTLKYADLRLLGMQIYHNGEPAIQGIGAAALGHPARAVAWLANTLNQYHITLKPGDIVLSGALGATIPAAPGDTFTVCVTNQEPLTVHFE